VGEPGVSTSIARRTSLQQLRTSQPTGSGKRNIQHWKPYVCSPGGRRCGVRRLSSRQRERWWAWWNHEATDSAGPQLFPASSASS